MRIALITTKRSRIEFVESERFIDTNTCLSNRKGIRSSTNCVECLDVAEVSKVVLFECKSTFCYGIRKTVSCAREGCDIFPDHDSIVNTTPLSVKNVEVIRNVIRSAGIEEKSVAL